MVEFVYVTFSDSGGMLHYAVNLAEGAGKASSAGLAVFSEAGKEEKLCAVPCFVFSRKGRGRIQRLYLKYSASSHRRAAKELVRRTSAVLVHMTTLSVCFLAFVQTLSRKGVKVVCTIHDPKRHDETRTWWGRIVEFYQSRFQLPRVFRIVDAIHVHSERHRDILLGMYGHSLASKIYVVQHGGGIAPSIREGSRRPPELGSIDEDSYHLLFFGRIHPYKGLNNLEQAIKMARNRGCSVSLIVAGQGDLGGLFRETSEGDVIVNRFVGDDEVASLFRAASVVVLPYTSGTQSGVIPLAYGYGRPVICTRVGALDEIVLDNQTGLLVAPGSAEELADAIIRLADKDMRMRLGHSAKGYLETHLDWSRIADEHIQVYRRIISARELNEVVS